MEPLPRNEDYLLSLFEVCEILGRSSRTVTRYVHKHILHPRGIKSRQGTLEYRFSRAEIDEFKRIQDATNNYVYPDDDRVIPASPMASFADYNYQTVTPPQATFLIPGISFSNPSEPTTALPRTAGSRPDKFVPGAGRFAPPAAENIKKESATPAPAAAAAKEEKNFPDQKRADGEIISLLKQTTEMLRDQLKTKDDQIKNLDDKIGQLIERNRETNILLKGLQDKIMLLEKPKKEDAVRSENPSTIQPAGQAASAPEDTGNFNAARGTANPVRIRVMADYDSRDDQPDTRVKLGENEIPVSQAAPRPNADGAGQAAGNNKGIFGKWFKQ